MYLVEEANHFKKVSERETAKGKGKVKGKIPCCARFNFCVRKKKVT